MTPERLAVNDRWYSEDEVYKLLQREQPLLIPHAAWFTRHLNLAFSKGKQLGSGEVTADIDQLRVDADRWQVVLANAAWHDLLFGKAGDEWIVTTRPALPDDASGSTAELFTAAIDKVRTEV